jgi:hypothetical protein
MVVGIHTENEAVGAEAINLTKELFCKEKQLAVVNAGQVCTEGPAVLPHCPLKSQTSVAVAQEEVDGNVLAHAGRAGGAGAGVGLAKKSVQLFNVPVPVLFRLSSIHKLQVPSAFCPLFTAPSQPSGKKFPVKGAVPDLTGMVPVAIKQVLLKLLPLPPLCIVSGTIVPSGALNTISRSPTFACVISIQTLASPRFVSSINPTPDTTAGKQVWVVARFGIVPPVPLKVCASDEKPSNSRATKVNNTLIKIVSQYCFTYAEEAKIVILPMCKCCICIKIISFSRQAVWEFKDQLSKDELTGD